MFLWRSFPFSSAGARWDAGPCNWHATCMILKNRCWSAMNICTKKTCIYMSCTYTKISLTRNETVVFPPLCAYNCKNEGFTDVSVLIVKQMGWSATVCCCTDWNKLDDFSAETPNRPKTGQCGPLMYVHKNVCFSGIFILVMVGTNASRKCNASRS